MCVLGKNKNKAKSERKIVGNESRYLCLHVKTSLFATIFRIAFICCRGASKLGWEKELQTWNNQGIGNVVSSCMCHWLPYLDEASLKIFGKLAH